MDGLPASDDEKKGNYSCDSKEGMPLHTLLTGKRFTESFKNEAAFEKQI